MRRHRRPPRGGALRAALRARPVAARSGPRGTLAVVEILLVDLEVPHVVAAPAPVGDDVAHLPPHIRGLERHTTAVAAAVHANDGVGDGQEHRVPTAAPWGETTTRAVRHTRTGR